MLNLRGIVGIHGSIVLSFGLFSRPEYKFQAKHTSSGTLYWVRMRV